MTSRRSILLSLVLGAFLGIFGLNSVYAQVPRSISYQGLLVKNNQPVNGTVDLKIVIYDAASNKLYEPPVMTGVSVANGIFNVLIGGSNVGGSLPTNLKFDQQYYLGVSVDGTAELPKTAFVAAPYALNSQTVGGVGVSVTPQPGMLLPLDQNGKIPKAVLPQAAPTLTTIDMVGGDANGNIHLASGPGITIVDNQASNTITFGLTSGSASPDTIAVGPGLTGGGIGTKWTLGIAQSGNWITNNMIGTGVITGMKLDQFVPENGLYQDFLGNLNVGVDSTMIYNRFGTAPTTGSTPPRNIGLNLGHTNNWTAMQNFLGGFSGSFGTLGTLGVNGTYLTVNGLAEPLAAPNGAVYEIQDNGDLRVTGSTTTWGNTYLGVGPTNNANSLGTGQTTGGTNTIGTAGQSANTVTGSTNAITGTTANNVQSPANNIGTTQAAGNTNTIGTAGNSTNTITGATNNTTGTVANNSQAPTVNIGTTQAAGNTVNIGTAGNSANTMTGATNTLTASTSNNVQSPANNIGTTNANSANTIGNAGTSANVIQGASNNIQGSTNNVGTTTAGSANTVGNAGTSTNTITGANNTITATTQTTFNGNVVHNGVGEPNAPTAASVTNYEFRELGDLQVSGATNLIGNVFMNQALTVGGATTLTGLTNNGTFVQNGASTFNGNITQTSGTTTLLGTTTGPLTVVGAFTQSGGNAAIAGGATNSFGTVAGSANSIGGAGSANTYNGSNTFNGNITQTAGTTTLLATTTGNLQVNGTLGSTGNITLGTSSSNNSIGAPGAINTFTGATNNLNATTANNVTGDLVQISGRAALAPTASTINSFGTGASQTNNISSGNGTTTTIGNGSGNVNNIGTAVAGASTLNVGNLNAGTTNNIKGLTTFQYSTTGNTVIIAGGPTTCAGAFPTSATSQLYADGDAYFAGTVAACRLNIFGLGGSCITNLNTTNFGSCGGPGVPINLISSIIGVPSGAGATDITNMRNIQAQNSVQTNTTLTIGTTGTNATNITSSNPGPGPINQQTPTVSGKLPTYQTYTLSLIPGTGPNGGGSATFNAGSAPGINFDGNDALMVSYRSHNLGLPVGALYITSVPGVSITVESSAANDNNVVQLLILRD